MKFRYHCIISIVKEIRFIIGNFLKQAAAPIPPPPPPPGSIIFVSDDGNLPVKYRPKTEVLELPALSFQTAHNRVEGAGEVTVSSTKCLECRSRESAPLRSGREAPTLSAGTVLAAKPEDWSTAPQHLLPMLERRAQRRLLYKL